MNHNHIRDWGTFRLLRAVDPDAAERGRLLTAHLMASDVSARKRGEDAFGVDFCRKQYPEAYRWIGRAGIARVLDTVRKLTPW